MATKTTTKTTARKTATARRPVKAAVSSRAPAHTDPKRKETKSGKAEAPVKLTKPASTHAPAKPRAIAAPSAPKPGVEAPLKRRTEPPAKPVEAAKPKLAPHRAVETVSLIEEKKPRPKRPE